MLTMLTTLTVLTVLTMLPRVERALGESVSTGARVVKAQWMECRRGEGGRGGVV